MAFTLSNQALTTIEKVNAVGGRDGDDKSQDQAKIVFIEAASRMASDYCNREFRPATDETGTRRFAFTGAGFVSFGRFDLQAGQTTTISVDADTANPIALTADQYQLSPVHAPHGVYTYLRTNTAFYPLRYPALSQAIPFTGPVSGLGGLPRTIDVTGTWGWPTIPDHVDTAIAVAALIFLQMNQETFSSTFNVETGRYIVPAALPAEVRGVLDPLKKAT
jgi:hypothetical protein